MIIRGCNDLYEGWLSWLLKQPYDASVHSAAWCDGWRMADETGPGAVEVLRDEIELQHIVVLPESENDA